jgi:hypothetical protein
VVGFDEEDLGAGALEADDFAGGGLAAIEAEIVGAGAPGEGVGEDEVGVEVGDFEVELAGAGVPVEGEEAGHVFHAGGLGFDGGDGAGFGGGGARTLGRHWGCGKNGGGSGRQEGGGEE